MEWSSYVITFNKRDITLPYNYKLMLDFFSLLHFLLGYINIQIGRTNFFNLCIHAVVTTTTDPFITLVIQFSASPKDFQNVRTGDTLISMTIELTSSLTTQTLRFFINIISFLKNRGLYNDLIKYRMIRWSELSVAERIRVLII